MSKENAFIDYFYTKYKGRISLGVGYGQELREIFPFVFKNISGNSIGIIALDVLSNGIKVVHIYHLSTFVAQSGNGTIMMEELCRKADSFDIHLSVSAIPFPNGEEGVIESSKLIGWYRSFGFKGDERLTREPIALSQ